MSSEVVEGRRALLQRCLQDTLATRDPRALQALAHFLPPPPVDEDTSSTAFVDAASLVATRSASHAQPAAAAAVFEPGARISLCTDLPPARSDAELLRVQHGRCAGCRAPISPDLLAAKGGVLGGWNTKKVPTGHVYGV